MQHVDRPADVQPLSQPAGARRPCVQAKPVCLVPRAERFDRISAQHRRRRDLGQEAAIRSPEAERAVGLPVQVVPLLVDGTMVPATQEREVGERGRAALGPVADVMPFPRRPPAAREAAAAIPVLERAT